MHILKSVTSLNILKLSTKPVVHLKRFFTGHRHMATDLERSPLLSGKYIAESSEDVKIDPEGVKATAKLILQGLKGTNPEVHVDRWKLHVLNAKTADEKAIDWVFLIDIGNFSFWSDDASAKYMVRYAGQEWTGYWAWVAAVNRALDEGVPFTSAKFLANLTKDQLEKILRSDSEAPIPIMDERVKVLKEAGQVLLQKYEGSVVNLLKKADHSAQKCLELLTTDFTSLQDVADYKGKTVSLYKRAQILIADIWASCSGKGLGQFDDIETITMFADYRIPQALAWFGALKYSDTLVEKMNAGEILENGQREEVEIRGCTIWAVKLIEDEVKQMIQKDDDIPDDTQVNAIMIDHYLWDYRREHATETNAIPFHRTRCIYY